MNGNETPESNFWSPVLLWVVFLFQNLTISGWFLSTVSVQNEKYNIPLPSFLCAGWVGGVKGFPSQSLFLAHHRRSSTQGS